MENKKKHKDNKSYREEKKINFIFSIKQSDKCDIRIKTAKVNRLWN